jgi:hypothetical protein
MQVAPELHARSAHDGGAAARGQSMERTVAASCL